MIRRLETPTRYYFADLHRDLLGDVVVVSVNGGKFNRLGHMSTSVVPTWEAGLALLEQIAERRRKHSGRTVL